MTVTDDGMFTFSSEEQPLKQLFLSSLKFEGITKDLSVNDSQPLKAEGPKTVTVGGMETSVSDEH